MAISYPLSLPAAFKLARITIAANDVVGVSESPFTGEQQIYQHQGQWLEATVTLPPMVRDDAEEVVAFLFALNGRVGTFLMKLPGGGRGAASGSPVVDGASQTGAALAIRGASASITNWLKAGDWLQIGSGATARLHKVLTAANTDSSGKATLDLWPRLRYSPADGAPVTLSNPMGLWRLMANKRDYDIQQAMMYGVSFACREAL